MESLATRGPMEVLMSTVEKPGKEMGWRGGGCWRAAPIACRCLTGRGRGLKAEALALAFPSKEPEAGPAGCSGGGPAVSG